MRRLIQFTLACLVTLGCSRSEAYWEYYQGKRYYNGQAARFKRERENEKKRIERIKQQLIAAQRERRDCQPARESLRGLLEALDGGGLAAAIRSVGRDRPALLAAIQEYQGAAEAWLDAVVRQAASEEPAWAATGHQRTLSMVSLQIEEFGNKLPDAKQMVLAADRVQLLLERAIARLEDARRPIRQLLAFDTSCLRLDFEWPSETAKSEHPLVALRREINALLANYRVVLDAVKEDALGSCQALPARIMDNWRRKLSLMQMNIQLARANGVVSTYYRWLNDGPTYDSLNQQLTQGQQHIMDLYYDQLSPRMALRAARVFRVLLDDVDGNIPGLLVTSDMQQRLIRLVGGTRATHASMLRQLEETPDFYHEYFAIWRQEAAEMALAGREVSEQCTRLARGAGTQSLDGELSFRDFLRHCTDGGAR